MEDLKWACNLPVHKDLVFLIRGLITASLNGFGTWPKDNEELIILRSDSYATGNNSFNNLVGTGSNKHVVGLDAVISLFSSSCPIVVKHCSFSLGAMNEAEVLDAVESTFVIVFLILFILAVNKFIKSLLLNCKGIFRSGDICLFVNLATVLNKNLGLFWLLSMSLQICSVLAAFKACL